MKTSDNISGYVGVFYVKSRDKYASKVMVDGKSKQIGQYDTPLEGAIARDKYIEEHNIVFVRKPHTPNQLKNLNRKGRKGRTSNIENKTIYICEKKKCQNLCIQYTVPYEHAKHHFCSVSCRANAGHPLRGAKTSVKLNVSDRIKNYFKVVDYE